MGVIEPATQNLPAGHVAQSAWVIPPTAVLKEPAAQSVGTDVAAREQKCPFGQGEHWF